MPDGNIDNMFNSSLLHVQETEKWEADCVISVNPKKVEGWALPDMPGMTLQCGLCIGLKVLVPNFFSPSHFNKYSKENIFIFHHSGGYVLIA